MFHVSAQEAESSLHVEELPSVKLESNLRNISKNLIEGFMNCSRPISCLNLNNGRYFY